MYGDILRITCSFILKVFWALKIEKSKYTTSLISNRKILEYRTSINLKYRNSIILKILNERFCIYQNIKTSIICKTIFLWVTCATLNITNATIFSIDYDLQNIENFDYVIY